MALFSFGRARPEDAARRRIEEWAREAIACGPETVIKANEIVCADPACPGVETVILVMAPGKRSTAYKIAKDAAEVTQADVAAALTGQGS